MLFLALLCYNYKLLTLDCNGQLLGNTDPYVVLGVTLLQYANMKGSKEHYCIFCPNK